MTAGSGPDLPPALRDGPHVFVDDLDHPVLEAEDDRHLRRVLRLRPGAALTASDGRGRWRSCRLGADGLDVDGDVVPVAAPRPRITVAVAPPKGERPEWMVGKLTELGVDRIVLLEAARSVVRWDPARAPRHLERLRRVARSAAQQSRRCHLPVVEGMVAPGSLVGPGVALADPGGEPLDLTTPTVLIGPEGGWADEERDVGVRRVRLAAGVLRTETAAVAAATLLGALRAGVVAPGG